MKRFNIFYNFNQNIIFILTIMVSIFLPFFCFNYFSEEIQYTQDKYQGISENTTIIINQTLDDIEKLKDNVFLKNSQININTTTDGYLYFDSSYNEIKIIFGKSNLDDMSILNTDRNYGVFNPTIIKGNYFSQYDFDGVTKSVIISETMAMVLYQNLDCIGESLTIRVNNTLRDFLVLGIYKSSISDIEYYDSKTSNLKLFTSTVILPNSTIEDNFNYEIIINSDVTIANSIQDYYKNDFNCLNIKLNIDNKNKTINQLKDQKNIFGSLSLVLVFAITFILYYFMYKDRLIEIGIRKISGGRFIEIWRKFNTQFNILTLLGILAGSFLGIVFYELFSISNNKLLNYQYLKIDLLSIFFIIVFTFIISALINLACLFFVYKKKISNILRSDI
ncbi:MAG: ABC transporter permease [Acholeplasmatales bacterium]|jgi:ABC-type antimicrobial peptide transport system permease subunit|nr:ABC transporter permease [Acholeplasmatales bacterium]